MRAGTTCEGRSVHQAGRTAEEIAWAKKILEQEAQLADQDNEIKELQATLDSMLGEEPKPQTRTHRSFEHSLLPRPFFCPPSAPPEMLKRPSHWRRACQKGTRSGTRCVRSSTRWASPFRQRRGPEGEHDAQVADTDGTPVSTTDNMIHLSHHTRHITDATTHTNAHSEAHNSSRTLFRSM